MCTSRWKKTGAQNTFKSRFVKGKNSGVREADETGCLFACFRATNSFASTCLCVCCSQKQKEENCSCQTSLEHRSAKMFLGTASVLKLIPVGIKEFSLGDPG
ncbi:hypothetical protein CHARACLAT_022269 [Characodon lateralis]|uniref:Uncharacterized protein n=1 Tax=Characodon lateralis TaxID=208331 RepID=A0ABU7DWS0_9TELE|nr:hypothetical protein [Characodon lateralis]